MSAHVGKLSLSVKHGQRITERLGRERARQREENVERMKAGELEPVYRQSPKGAAIHLEAGKIRLRGNDAREPRDWAGWDDVG